MKALPYLPLFIFLVTYVIVSWVLSFYQAVWLAWLFAGVAPVAGALAWILAEDNAVPAAGCMLLILTMGLAGLLWLTGAWTFAVGLVIMVGVIFFLPVPNEVYATLTHAVAIAACVYISIPSNISTALLLPVVISIPAVTTWAWVRIEMPVSQFTRKKTFIMLSCVAWAGIGIGWLAENLSRLSVR